MKNLYERIRSKGDFSNYNWKCADESFRKFISTPRRLLFHPWGDDAEKSTIAYLNRDWIKQLPNTGPEIFIIAGKYESHSLFTKDMRAYGNRYFYQTEIRINQRGCSFTQNEDGRENINFLTNVRLPSGNVWVIETNEWRDDDMLRFFLDEKMEVDYIYSTAEFIPMMPDKMDAYPLSALYYSPFYDALGVKAHINPSFLDPYQYHFPGYSPYPAIPKTRMITNKLKDRTQAARINRQVNVMPTMPDGFRKVIINEHGKLEFMHKRGFTETCMWVRE